MAKYVPNPSFASNSGAPSFPIIDEDDLEFRTCHPWAYTDRRSLQEIVPGIFIGPLATARDPDSLDRLGIKTLVAVRTQTTWNIFKPLFPHKYRYEPLDIVEGSLLGALPRVKPFVDACLARGENILFYDETGNAKAPLIVCSYLMEAGPMDSRAAYSYVKSKRISACLSNHERYQLQEFETLLNARNTIMAHSYSPQELNRSSCRRKFSDCADDDDDQLVDGSYTDHTQSHRNATPFVEL